MFCFYYNYSYYLRINFHGNYSIVDIIPDLIECELDILNPVQASARGMDAENLKTQFCVYIKKLFDNLHLRCYCLIMVLPVTLKFIYIEIFYYIRVVIVSQKIHQ